MQSISEALEWLKRETQGLQYGSCSLTITAHAGAIKRIEKSVTVSQQIVEKSEAK